MGFLGGSVVKNPPANVRRHWFNPWVRKIPWRRKWQPAPVFLPGKSNGQRSLGGYSPQGHKESDVTERLSAHTCKLGERLLVWLSSSTVDIWREKLASHFLFSDLVSKEQGHVKSEDFWSLSKTIIEIKE